MEVFWNLLRVRRTRSPQIFPPGLQVWQRKSDPYPKLNIDTVANSSCSELKDDELHLADVNVQSPETPGWFSLRLDVYAPSQVLRTYRCVYHPPLPSVLLEPLQAAGLLRSTNVTSLHRYYKPDRHPLAFCRLPGVSGYTASLLRRFRDGTRRASPVAQHVLVIVLSLSPRQSGSPRRSICDGPCCLRP